MSQKKLRTAAVAAAGLFAVVAGWAGPAGTAEAAPLQLSIAIDDGRTTADPAQKLDYVVTVSNLGTAKTKDLVVTVSVPQSAELVSSDGATRKGNTVSWKVDVAPGKTVTKKTRVAVATKPPADLLRFAVIACAAASAKAPPVVCAADSDQLPAGAAAEKTRSQLETPAAASRPAWLVPSAVGAGGLVVVGLAGLLIRSVVRRRREA